MNSIRHKTLRNCPVLHNSEKIRIYIYIQSLRINKIGVFFLSLVMLSMRIIFRIIKKLRLSARVLNIYTGGSCGLIDEEKHLFLLPFSFFLFSSFSSSASSSTSSSSFFGATHTREDKVEDDRRSK